MPPLLSKFSSYILLTLLVAFPSIAGSAFPQEKIQPGKPIDIDRALRAPDRAQSYYHYSLGRWYEEKGEIAKALSEMRKAADYNDTSSLVRVELANILAKSGEIREALEEAGEACRLDPKNPEPYLLLANIHYRRYREHPVKTSTTAKDFLRKSVEELEKMREVAPTDERSYFILGGAYFDLEEPEKAIQAYEAFQSLVRNTDVGFLNIAKYYEKAGNQEKAIEYLTKAVNSQSESLESMIMLAGLYAKLNRDKEAIPLYKKVLQLTRDNMPVRRQLGSTLVEAGQFEEAIELLEEIIEASPQDKDILTLLGRAQLGARQTSKAIDSFKKVLEGNPSHIEAEFYLGTSYEQSGNPAEAAKVFAALLEKTRSATGNYSNEQKANRAVFQQHLAMSYQDMGEYDKAIAIYEDLAKSEPEPNPRLLFLLINAYRINRQLDKALALAKQHFEKKPNEQALGLVYARTLADVGKTGQGADVLNKLLQADPSNLDLYVNLSQIYLQGKRFSDAEKVLRRGQEKEPDSERLKFQLAAVYERQKDFDRAETLFKEVLKANPGNASALNYIGYMLADRGVRLQEAVEYVEKALALEPNNGAYMDSLGWAFFKLNDLEQAEKYLLKAAAVVKNDPVIHDHLGDLYYKTGDYQKAQDFWNKSLVVGTEEEELHKVREKLEKLKDTLRKQKRRQ